MRRLVKISFIFILSIVLLIFLSDRAVEKNGVDRLYNSSKRIPPNKTALLLGTIKYNANGRINLYYKYRIDAAVKLYKAGKVEYILVSGDNSRKNYDEPTAMKEDLIARGVPAEKIYLDYAGFRTLDSVVRAKEVFGQTSLTIISQQFHNERALYIAKRKGIDAVAYNARSVGQRYGLKTRIRERFARVKMMLELTIGKKPRFLGEKIVIGNNSN